MISVFSRFILFHSLLPCNASSPLNVIDVNFGKSNIYSFFLLLSPTFKLHFITASKTA